MRPDAILARPLILQARKAVRWLEHGRFVPLKSLQPGDKIHATGWRLDDTSLKMVWRWLPR